jgi:protein-tyrosine phosphatase
VIDLHCHVLPGIDDGPRTVEGSLALARAAADAGIRTLVATPHVSARYPNDSATIARLAHELRERLAQEGIEIELLTGAEVAMTHLLDIPDAELERLRLGGSGWLLVEPPFAAADSSLDAIMLGLMRRKHRLLIAHPERCSAFRRDRRMLETLVAAGALSSITAGSLVGSFGEDVRRFTLELVHAELVHDVASDAHDHVHRAPGLREQLAQAGLAPLQRWLTEEVPAALLADRAPPPRPHVALAPALAPQAPRSRWRVGR